MLGIGKQCTLKDLKIGQKARIIYISNKNRLLFGRLLEMGITVGVDIVIKKISPFGDPVCVELRGYELCIRGDVMKQIRVEVLL